MPHLVASLVGPISLAACADQIRAAHDYLARQGAQAIDRAWVTRDVTGWGAAVKRIRVELPLDGRPDRIAFTIRSHSLIEVINQCATMERLLDALAWAQTPEAGLADAQVMVCHPTTSSAKGEGVTDNDLVLEGRGGVVAWGAPLRGRGDGAGPGASGVARVRGRGVVGDVADLV